MSEVLPQVHRWTERDDSGRVWLCWYEPSSDPRESRSWLIRTLIGVPVTRATKYTYTCRAVGGLR